MPANFQTTKNTQEMEYKIKSKDIWKKPDSYAIKEDENFYSSQST
jgi:hypothetical protein